MHRNNRPQLWILIGLIGLLFTLQSVGAQDQPVFNIGVLDNERGAISSGARMAVREINDAGGVRGADGTIFRLDLVIQPSNFGANLTQAVSTLHDANVIAVLGPETDDEVLNGLPTLQSPGRPDHHPSDRRHADCFRYIGLDLPLPRC